jgi:hypothetical protein
VAVSFEKPDSRLYSLEQETKVVVAKARRRKRIVIHFIYL